MYFLRWASIIWNAPNADEWLPGVPSPLPCACRWPAVVLPPDSCIMIHCAAAGMPPLGRGGWAGGGRGDGAGDGAVVVSVIVAPRMAGGKMSVARAAEVPALRCIPRRSRRLPRSTAPCTWRESDLSSRSRRARLRELPHGGGPARRADERQVEWPAARLL